MKAVLLTLGLLLAVDSSVWFWACGRLRSGLDQQVALAMADGWSIGFAGVNRRGWPFAARLQIDDVVVSAGPGAFPAGLSWRAERAQLRLSPLHPTSLAITAEGRQVVSARGVPAIPFTARAAAGTFDLAGNAAPVLRIEGLALTLPSGVMRVARGGLGLPARSARARLAELSAPMLPPVERLDLDLAWTAAPAPAATAAGSARAWRDAGGRIDVTRLAIDGTGFTATGTGVFTLDEALQPTFAGQLAVIGGGVLIDGLERAGALSANAALPVRAAYAVLAAPAGNGTVTLPISLRDSVVSVARVPVLRVAPLAWD